MRNYIITPFKQGTAFDLGQLKKELSNLEKESAKKDFWNNKEKAALLMKKVEVLRGKTDFWDKFLKDISELKELFKISGDDRDLLEEVGEKYRSLRKLFKAREKEIYFVAGDENGAILTIHAGTGGTDAQDFAEMLLRMYMRFSEKKKWQASLLEEMRGEEAGIKRATLEVKTPYAHGFLKSEAGVHRLVRLSPFNADNLRQTSFVFVEVVPLVEESEIEIKDSDLKIEAFRAGGPGGQNVNKVSSAVRLIHIPTEITVSCQNERSQAQNKETALKILKSKLEDLKKKEEEEEKKGRRAERKRIQWGSQIRSYILHPYKMVKDKRSGLELNNVEAVLDGDLDKLIEGYLKTR